MTMADDFCADFNCEWNRGGYCTADPINPCKCLPDKDSTENLSNENG